MGLPHAVCNNQTVATAQTNYCVQFAQRLADRAAPRGFRVWLADENGTSGAARTWMEASGVARARREGLVDAVAAALILENYFSQRCGLPRLVAPAKGLPRMPPAERGLELSLAWLGESDGARGGRAARAMARTAAAAAAAHAATAEGPEVLAGEPPVEPPVLPLLAAVSAPRGGIASPKPPAPPLRTVPVRLLRRETVGFTRRELWEQSGL